MVQCRKYIWLFLTIPMMMLRNKAVSLQLKTIKYHFYCTLETVSKITNFLTSNVI